MKNKTAKWIAGSVLAIGLGISSFFLWKRTQKDSNQKKDREAPRDGIDISRNPRGEAIAEPNWNHPFGKSYASDVIRWVAPQKVIKLKDEYARKLAEEVLKAKGLYFFSNDDEEAIQQIFKEKLKDKVAVSNLAEAFLKLKKGDLENFLKSFLNQSEMQKYVYTPISKLNNYRTL